MASEKHLPRSHADYTVACICPMGVELAPVLAMLDETHESLPPERDQNEYNLGSIGQHNVVVAVLPEIENNAAATVATQLLRDFPSVRFGLVVGIGGGVPGDEDGSDIRLGDLVVSQPTATFGGAVQYDLGKRLVHGGFKRTGHLNKPPSVLSTSVRKLQAQYRMSGSRISLLLSDMTRRYPKMQAEYLFPSTESDQLFQASYPHQEGPTCERCDSAQIVARPTRLDNEPHVYYGTIASVNIVVKDPSIRDMLKKDMKIMCVETEAVGIMDNFPCLIIRGICDYADSHKNERWQPYASAVAAAYMKELLAIIPAQQVLQTARSQEVTLPDHGTGHKYGDFSIGGSAMAHIGDVHNYFSGTSNFSKAEDPARSPTASERQFLESIGPRQYFDIQERVEGTCTWSSETPQYRSWLQATRSSVLWITGGAGTGKTTLTNYLVEQLKDQYDTWYDQSAEHTTCSFFCSRDIRGRHDINFVLQDLVRQLAEPRTKIIRHIKAVFGTAKRDYSLSFEGVWRMFENVLLMLPCQCVYIVIDALDECDGDLRSRLFQKLSRALSSMTNSGSTNVRKIKLIISGQPQIRSSWSAAARSIDHHHINVDDRPSGVRRDISLFINTRIAELVEDSFCSQSVGEDLKRVLESTAENSFLWLDVVMKHIKSRLRYHPADLEQLLSHVPETLQQAYAKYLPPISVNEIPVLRRYLQLLTSATRPLKLVEINALVTIMEEKLVVVPELTVGDEKVVKGTLERALGPLVRFSQNTAQFIHSTAKDFFILLEQQPHHALHGSHGINIAKAHFFCAKSCMIYLLHDGIPTDLFDMRRTDSLPEIAESPVSDQAQIGEDDLLTNLFDLGEVQFLRDQESVEKETCLDIQQRFQAYDYAAQNWTDHLARCEDMLDNEVLAMSIDLLSRVSDRANNWYRYRACQTHLLMPSLEDASPIVLAAMFNLPRLMGVILDDSNRRSTPQMLSSALFWAASRGSCSAVKLLLQHGVPTSPTSTRGIPLAVAAQGNFQDVCNLLLQVPNLDPNELGSQGKPALILAAEANHSGVLRMLLKHKSIRVDQADSDGRTALMAACRNGSTECVRILREDGRADVNCADAEGRVALHHASKFGDLLTLKELLKCSSLDPHAKDYAGRNAISIAAQEGRRHIVRQLYHNEVDPTGTDIHGRNAISWAANSIKSTSYAGDDRESVLEYLVRKIPGASDEPDENGWSPLAWALDTPGYLISVQILLNSPKVDINRRDGTSGRCILSWAASSGMKEIVECLMGRSDLDANSTCSSGRTPLSYAAANGRIDIVRLILQAKDVSAEQADHSGRSPADWASLNNHSEVVNLLHGHLTR